MAFSVKDFWSYTDDPSTLKDLVVLVAKPGGGGFSLINMTKEEFFNVAATMTLKFNPSTSTDLITFNDANSVKARYLGATDYLFFDNLKRMLFSDDGSTNEQIEFRNEASEAKITIGGNSPTNGDKKGLLLIYTDAVAFGTTLASTVTADLTANLSNPRNENDPTTVNVQYREDRLFDRSTVSTGGSTDIPSSYRTIYQAESNGGGIASHTFNMPAVLGGTGSAGNIVRLIIIGTITSVTMATPGPETIEGAFTTAVGALNIREWIYDPSGVWRRIE